MKRVIVYSFLVVAGLSFSGCLNSDDDVFNSADQFQSDLQAIDQYLLANGINAEIDEISGIRYVIDNTGDGLRPVVADSLTISYVGKVLADESTFETVENEKRITGAWLQGVLSSVGLIQEGGSITAYVPSQFGFGQLGATGVPANSPLILEVDFHELNDSRLKSEIQVINDSLTNWQIEAETHPTGIRFILEQGNGAFPSFNSNVTVNYDVRLLGNSASIETGDGVSFNLLGLIPAWRIMIPEMREGGTMTIYVPASLAYGTQGTATISPNANLEFDIDLISTD